MSLYANVHRVYVPLCVCALMQMSSMCMSSVCMSLRECVLHVYVPLVRMSPYTHVLRVYLLPFMCMSPYAHVLRVYVLCVYVLLCACPLMPCVCPLLCMPPYANVFRVYVLCLYVAPCVFRSISFVRMSPHVYVFHMNVASCVYCSLCMSPRAHILRVSSVCPLYVGFSVHRFLRV